jgi:hypothetical protein
MTFKFIVIIFFLFGISRFLLTMDEEFGWEGLLLIFIVYYNSFIIVSI